MARMAAYEFPITNDLLTMTCIMVSAPHARMQRAYGLALNDYRTLAYIEQGMATTATELSKALDIAKCKVTGHVGRLCDLGYVRRGEKEGSRVPLATTSVGSAFFRECRGFLLEGFDDMLVLLDGSQRRLYDMGCTATATMADGFRLVEEAPDLVYIYLRSCLLTEQSITKTTRRHGLGLMEFRVMFALLQNEGMTSSELVSLLLVPKSTASKCLDDLERRGLVSSRRLDGRSRALFLTQSGRVSAETVARDVDRSFMQDVRTAQPFERSLYVAVASKIVERQRTLGSNRVLR